MASKNQANPRAAAKEAKDGQRLRDLIENGVFVTIVLGLVALAFYMGRVDNQVEGFGKRIENLEDLDGISAKKDEAITSIDQEKGAAVRQAQQSIDDTIETRTKSAIEDIEEKKALALANIDLALKAATKTIEASRSEETTVVDPKRSRQQAIGQISVLERQLTNFLSGIPDTPDNHLVLGDGQKFDSRDAETHYRSVTLGRNSTLSVPPDFDKLTLRTLSLKVGRGARIVAKGIDGKSGNHGEYNDRTPSDCVAGNKGPNGVNGQDGGSGNSVTLETIDLVLAGQFVVETSGGSGGSGGNGARGQNGGRADRSKGCPGGNGGPGGTGGMGGNGGDGGDSSIQYVRALASDGEKIGQHILEALVEHVRSPGGAGPPGLGGKGGSGGAGRGKGAFGSSLPRGSNGTDARPLGESGRPGRRGGTEISPS